MMWSKLPITEAQANAIASYERTWNVKIHCNNKQDAHDVISLFVKNRSLTFKESIFKDNSHIGGIIVGTTVTWDRVDKSLDIIFLSIKQFDDYERELLYDADLRDLDDEVFGCNPYNIIS